jgi:fumarate hydratase subunit beta
MNTTDFPILTLPLKRDDVERLQVGDMVLLSGQITVTIGLPTHQRMLDYLAAGQPLPVDLKDGAFFHLSCFNREGVDGTHEALYMNPAPARATTPVCRA